jgi:hypothetical protein
MSNSGFGLRKYMERVCDQLLRESITNTNTGLEDDYPAEFLTLVHTANDEETKMYTLDADRFLAVAELRKLLEAKRINQEQFQASKSRIQGSNESIRRGINNLIRHHRLRESVSAALQYPYIRVHFKASAWRKLTHGHFNEASLFHAYCSRAFEITSSLACSLPCG